MLSDGVSTYNYDHANRLTGMVQGGNTYSLAYNGFGDRLHQTINGASTSYTLDLAGRLTQVIADEERVYLYGLNRIGQQGFNNWQYFLDDALNSVRQLSDQSGQIVFASAYEPFGSQLSSSGPDLTPYNYTGEWRDATSLIFLRARYLNTGLGRFLTLDAWRGQVSVPMTLNRYVYVANNPLAFRDPSGNQWDPSDPTHRGTIIHKMIQAQYTFLYSVGGQVGIEYPIPLASTGALRDIFSTVTSHTAGTGEELWRLHHTNAGGFADIIDFAEMGLYEIKPKGSEGFGAVQAGWYIAAFNETGRGYLKPGMKYPPPPGVIVGTDPVDPTKWVTGWLALPGVIVYSTKIKDDKVRQPEPIYVFEWNPEKHRVDRRNFSPGGLQPVPQHAYFDLDVDPDALKVCGLVAIYGAVGAILILTPIPDEWVWLLVIAPK
jgi:RHS repeat-associated protein